MANEELKKFKENHIQVEVPSSRVKDLTGQKYGRYTVQYYCGRFGRHYYWYCKCECGNCKVVRQDELVSGVVISCGCYHHEAVSNLFSDLTGETFGRLTVLKRVGIDNHRAALYKCKCQCGNVITVKSGSLRQGHTTSCGCSKSKGELKIAQFLSENNIKFTTQKTFDECKDVYALRFDFQIFISENNYFLCEYQGQQHFNITSFKNKQSEEDSKKCFENYQRRDNIKRQFCKDNNIKLLEISYWEFEDIEAILSKELNI